MDKNVDDLVAPTINKFIESMNREVLKKEDIIQIFEDNKGNYIAIFYK